MNSQSTLYNYIKQDKQKKITKREMHDDVLAVWIA